MTYPNNSIRINNLLLSSVFWHGHCNSQDNIIHPVNGDGDGFKDLVSCQSR